MATELFKNIPSKVGDLVRDVRIGKKSDCLICKGRLFGKIIRYVSSTIRC